MDLTLLKNYYEDNLNKGYTIEQISNNLKNSGYSEQILLQVTNSLDKALYDISKNNSMKYDYSKVPNDVKKNIGVPNQSMQPIQNTGIGSDVSLVKKNTVNNNSVKHDGLDKELLIKYGSIIAGIVFVVVVSLFFLISNDTNEFSSGGPMDRYEDALGINDDLDSIEPNDNFLSELDEEDFSNESNEALNHTIEDINDDLSSDHDVINDSSIEQNNNISQGNRTDEEFRIYSSLAGREFMFIGGSCVVDRDCFDGNLMTINYCEGGECQIKLNDGRPCLSGDGFCPPRCYGFEHNDTDCFDFQDRMICETFDHCNNFDNNTEDFCTRDGFCIHFDIRSGNHPPDILSKPPTYAIAYERFTYHVSARDEDGDTLTYSLENAPRNMTINSRNGFIEWYPEYEYSVSFRIIVSDGIDESYQDVNLYVYLNEENDPARSICGDERDCYYTYAVVNERPDMCKYLMRYWEETITNVDVYFCIKRIAQNTENASACNFIDNRDYRIECRNSI